MFPLGESKFQIGLVVKRESVHSRVDEGICCVSFQGILSSTLFSSCTIMLTPSPPRKTSTRHSEPVILQEVTSFHIFPGESQDI